MRPDTMVWMWSFKSAFSLSSFTLIKRVFSSSSLSVIRAVSSAYLSLLIFLSEILILVFDSSSPAFHLMYTEYKLNKQDDTMQPCHTPFPILNPFIFLDTNSLSYMICNFSSYSVVCLHFLESSFWWSLKLSICFVVAYPLGVTLIFLTTL